jgi:DNA repair photolyase
MSLIYSPKGKAGEYSPLAVNIYNGCNHGCFYCYVPKILGVYSKDYVHSELSEKNNFIDNLKKEQIK